MTQLHYTYPVDLLSTGSSLGNPSAFAACDAFSNLKGLWNASDNRYYAGDWTVSLEADGRALEPTGTIFNPESQTTMFSDGSLRVEKTVFLPFALVRPGELPPSYLKAAIMNLRILHEGAEGRTLSCRHLLTFPAQRTDLFTKQPPAEETESRVNVREDGSVCIAATVGRPSEARVFGTSLQWKTFRASDTGADIQYVVPVEPGQVLDLTFALAFSEQGEESARDIFRQCRDGAGMLRLSREAYAHILSRCEIVTPDPLINRGLQWAKVNSVRVQHRYRAGAGFTNDPPQDIIVIRDLAWYVFGMDYVTPDFCADLIAFTETYAYHEGGKLTEFLHAGEPAPEKHDYALNINDDTPLFVIALYHHAAAYLNDANLRRIYALMKRSADWIISQMKDGLVRCVSDGTNVWGICSWRNIIDNYNLTGAVTEVNAECCYALLVTSKVARRLGKTEDAQRYASAAEGLKGAINALLVSDKTRLYALNLDNNGVLHHDLTGDMVFPVLFDVAEPERRAAVLDALTTPDMWTPSGSRTVHPMESNFDPDFGYQLVGGIWPNLTAWIAYCLRKDNPAKMVEGMRNIFRACEVEKPFDAGRVVPGEFPERFHGKTYASMGMTLSPWMPPTYTWLGVEGLLGVEPMLSGLVLNPSIPADWDWIAVKNLLYGGESVDAFYFGGTLYVTRPVTTNFPVRSGKRVDVTCSSETLFPVAIKMESETLLFVCSGDGGEGMVKVHGDTGTLEKEVRLERGGASLFRLGVV